MTIHLPTVGGDDDVWGQLLNDFLNVSHDSVGGLTSAAVSAAGAEMTSNKDTDGTLAANSDSKYPSQKAVKTYADTKVINTTTVNGHQLNANVTVTKSDVGLGSVTNDAQLKAADLDTDGTLAANSDTKIASQKAAKTYVDTQLLTSTTGNLQGGVGEHMQNLNGWYAKYANVVKGTGKAKVLVLGDSISSFYGVRSWPGLLHGLFQSHRVTQGDGTVLGSRFPNSGSLSTNTTTTTTVGTYTQIGAGAQSSILASGNEFTQTFNGDAITIIYGTGAAAGSGLVAGTISVYDGPSSGTAVATVDASLGGTKYSQLLDVTGLTLGAHTVTVKVTGGTGTLIEQVVPHAGTLTQGVDLRTCARFGYTTASYLDSADPNSSQSGGLSNSHGLALIESWQPDLIINALGQNDNLLSTWSTNTASLYNSIFSLAPNTNILTMLMYATNNTDDRGGWIDSALTIAASHAGKVETLSLPLMMGTLDRKIQQYGTQMTTDDGIHPTYMANNMMMLSAAMKLTGEPLAVISNLPAIMPNMGVTWTGNVTGNVTGSVTGSLSGTVSQTTVSVTGSRSIDNSNDIGKLLYYNGSSDITLTLGLSGNYLNVLASVTDILQLGAGKITVDVSAWSGAGFPGTGPQSTTAPGDKLSFKAYSSPNTVGFTRVSSAPATKRVGTTTSSATPTINTDKTDVYKLTAQAVDITSFTTNLSGTPSAGQRLEIQITGTAARAITWGASFVSTTTALPTTTVSTNKLRVLLEWDSDVSKWACIGVS